MQNTDDRPAANHPCFCYQIIWKCFSAPIITASFSGRHFGTLGFSDWDSVKPEDFEAIRQNDTEFVTSEEFSKIKWIVNEHEDIYVPDYTDVLRVAFTFKFLRGRISDLASLL